MKIENMLFNKNLFLVGVIACPELATCGEPCSLSEQVLGSLISN